MHIDRLDADLLLTLRRHPRVGLLEVARRLGVARGTVQARLGKLEQRGVVTGYGPEVDPVAFGYRIRAYVMLELAQGRLDEATALLVTVPEIIEVDAVSGPQDLICLLVARDTEHLQEVLNRLVGTPAIRRSTSAIVLSRPVRFRTEPLLQAAGGGSTPARPAARRASRARPASASG